MQNNNKYLIKGMLMELGNLMTKVITLQDQIVTMLDTINIDEELPPLVPCIQTLYQTPSNQITTANSVQNILPNVLPNVLPNIVSNVVPNILPNVLPNVVSNVVPNVASNQCIVTVNSETCNGTKYNVDYVKGTCTCPNFKYSGPLKCKHIAKVGNHPGNFGLNNMQASNLKSIFP